MKKRHFAAPFVLTAMLSGPALADSKTVLQLEQDLLAELTLERAAA